MKINNFNAFNGSVLRAGSDALEPLTSPLCVRGGRFTQLDAAALPGRFEAHDLTDRVVVPGLIDAHVHLELDPSLRTPSEQLAVPTVLRQASMAARAVEMLASGITTTRDCGGGFHLEHALRDRIDGAERAGPRLLCCGRPITTVGGHCAFWGGEVETLPDVDRVVAQEIDAGSDWIKVMATGGVFTPGSRARDAQFDLPWMQSIVAAARRGGRAVAAHCHGTEGLANAVRAGVRTIEHASFAGPDGFGTALDESLMREMAQQELWVSPTIHSGWGRRIRDEQGQPTDFFQRHSNSLRKQRDHGIRFIASTDAGIPGVAHDDLVGGLIALQHYVGLQPVEVLRAATQEAAQALGVGGETGEIALGLSADFLVVEGNPLEDLGVLRDPEVVVFRGAWLDRATRRAMVEEARRHVEEVCARS